MLQHRANSSDGGGNLMAQSPGQHWPVDILSQTPKSGYAINYPLSVKPMLGRTGTQIDMQATLGLIATTRRTHAYLLRMCGSFQNWEYILFHSKWPVATTAHVINHTCAELPRAAPQITEVFTAATERKFLDAVATVERVWNKCGGSSAPPASEHHGSSLIGMDTTRTVRRWNERSNGFPRSSFVVFVS